MKLVKNCRGAALLMTLGVLVLIGIISITVMQSRQQVVAVNTGVQSVVDQGYFRNEIKILIKKNINCSASLADTQTNPDIESNPVKFRGSSLYAEPREVSLWLGDFNGVRVRKKFSKDIVNSNDNCSTDNQNNQGQDECDNDMADKFRKIEIVSILLGTDEENLTDFTSPLDTVLNAYILVKAKRRSTNGEYIDLQDIKENISIHFVSNSQGESTITECGSGVVSSGTDGSCGSAAGNASVSEPSSNLCSNGTSTAVTDEGTDWSWLCLGLSGGADIACSAPKDSASPIAGVCDNTTQNGCSAGNADDAAIADTVTHFRWICDGQNGGADSGTCEILKSGGVCSGSWTVNSGSCTGNYTTGVKINWNGVDYNWSSSSSYYSTNNQDDNTPNVDIGSLAVIGLTYSGSGSCYRFYVGSGNTWKYRMYNKQSDQFGRWCLWGTPLNGIEYSIGDLNTNPNTTGAATRIQSHSCSAVTYQNGDPLNQSDCTSQAYAGCVWSNSTTNQCDGAVDAASCTAQNAACVWIP